MKAKALLSIVVLLSLILAALPAPMAAQAPQTPSMKVLDEPMQLPGKVERAPQPEALAQTPAAPEAAWTAGPASPFGLTRFDGVFVPGPQAEAWANKVYFFGGRSGSSTEDPNIWRFDPATGAYTDTGTDMVEDVSNYTANLVENDGTSRGPAVYIIGGYNADGATPGNIGTVQRYYPQVNVAEALPAADNWTVLQSGSLVGAMGSAVVDDKIYVFGGWENLTAPYFYSGTWVFDPNLPSGSRWTNLNLALNPARSYIQVAVQNGKIYAMGGIYQYDGSDLVPTTVVEMLDTANLAVGWQLRSPLPVASAEGRGYGFDADTKAPAPWDDHIYLAGGGDWNGRSAEAMEYMVGSDSWDQAFPDLIQARRDHAGVFVPLCTADPTDGLPGLWVFGGNIAADDPPFGGTEFYPLPCSCSVLLVDDDWDQYSGEPYNGTGTYYYTSTLEALGYSYSRWDTWTQGDPSLTDLQPYDVVLWFTGYAWEETVTLTNEIDLAAYLDGGGNLILSAEDYLYDQGLTAFGQNYLGVGSYTGDVSDTDPVGNAGDPIGNGLGPYALTVPTSWPVGGVLYPDYAGPGGGAGSPFRFQASNEDNSTDMEGAGWKTAFLAWPLEGLASLSDRAAVVGRALSWMCAVSEAEVRLLPPWQQGNADPGATAFYLVDIYNLLGYEETFDLTYTGVWPTTGPATIGPIANGGSAQFTVQVTIPAGADCNAQDLAVVTAWDSTDTYSDTAEILTIAAGDWDTVPNSGATGAHWMAFACTDDLGTDGTCFYAGGLGAGNAVTGAAQRYDIATQTWTALPNLPTPVFGAVGGFVSGQFCVAGGFTSVSGDWAGTYATQCYNPGTNSWAAAAAIPGPVEIGGAGGATGGVTSGMLHVVAGCGANNCSSNQHFAFDGTTWTQFAPVPDYLSFPGAAVGEGKLFVGGDYTGSNGFYEYDSSSDSWVTRSGLPGSAGKKSPVGAVVPGGGAFWWGGDLGAWSGVQDTTWYYEPNTDGWVQFAATLNQATTGAGGGMANGALWNFGGSTGAGPISPPPHEWLEGWCVPPPPDAGALEGVVYDANTGLPIENARVWVVGVTDPNFYAERLTNAAGEYSFDPILAGDYLVTAAAYGYYTVLDVPAAVVADTPTVLDFDLDASDPDLQPKSVSVNLPVDGGTTFTMTLDNDGTGDLHFHITELWAARVLSPNKSDVAMPSGVDPQVYADLKASADGTGRFVVYLKDQADLEAAFGIEDWAARGQYVLDTLRATAQRSQAGLRAALDGAGAEYESRYIVNALVVTGNAALVDSLAARPEVGFIGPDAKIPAPKPVDSSAAPDSPELIEWNIKMILADSVWDDFGVTGQGVVLATIDSGAQYDHPVLVQQYRGNLGGSSFNHNYNWFDPYGQCPSGGGVPCDFSSHGTHVMGTMVGSDNPADPANATNAIGVAPGAKWIACKGGDAVSGYLLNAELIECAEWILAPWDLTGANPDPAKRPDAVNNSWGGGQAQWWYNQAIYAWRAAGIWPSFSNGNSGPSCGTAGDPGEMDNAISAGATTNTDVIAGFSSRGPASVTGLIKPDVSAPGDNIRSSVPTNGYANYSGTSMASPHVAATVGLIWSAVPELRGNVQITEWVLEQTADVKLDTQCGAAGPPNNVYGWGRINAYNAVDYALANTWDAPWLTVDPVSGIVDPSATSPIVLTFDATGLATGCYNAQLKVEYNDPYIVEEYIPVEMCAGQMYRFYLPIITKAYP